MKKLISFLLALVMMLTAVPALLAIAEDEAQTTPAFVIDGKLDEWYRDDDWAQENDCYFYYTMDDATLDPVSKKDGVSDVWLYEDVKVKIYVAYDDKYAYFYVDVLDPHIATEYDGSAYSQYIDNIDFYFDTDYLSCDGDFFTNCSNYEDADTHFRLVAHNLWIGDCKSEPKQIFEQEIVDNKIVDGVDTGEPNYNAVGYFRNSANTVPFQTFDDAGNLIGYGCETRVPLAYAKGKTEYQEIYYQIAVTTSCSDEDPQPVSITTGKRWWLAYDTGKTVYFDPDQANPFLAQQVTDEPSETEGIYDNFQYVIENNQATIIGYEGEGGVVEIPATINGAPVVAIGKKAFAKQSAITSVSFPQTLKTIGNRAFFGCTALTQLNLPQGVEQLDEYAFCGCTSLESVAIPASVTQIGEGAFSTCNALASFDVASGNANYSSVDGVLFNQEQTLLIQYPTMKADRSYTVPATVTQIGEEAFYGVAALTKITLPASVTAIGGYAFYDCVNLKTVTLPAGLTSLGDSVFFNCSGLVSASIPAGVTTLPYATFGGCAGLTTVTLPNTLTAIEEYAFFSCECLTSVVVPASVTQIAKSAFADCGSSLVLWGENGSYAQTYAGENNILFNVTNEDMPLFYLENVTAKMGDTFTVALKVKNNPGIVSTKLKLNFDANVLETQGLAVGDFSGVSFSPVANNPLVINWVDSLNANNTTDGVLAYITFRVKDDAPVGNTVLSLFYDGEDVFDFDYNNVTFGIQNGIVTVVDYIPGDLNDDGEIDNKDLSEFMRYLNAWGNEINEGAADVNRDGVINNKDYSILQRYLNGWDVTLK